MKHEKIVGELVEKYKKRKGVEGIYLFGSLAKGTANEKSDIDIEIIFDKRRKKYELQKKKIKGIAIDFSVYDKDFFLEEFKKYPYLMYAALNYKILYDPQGILKKHLKDIENYFNKNPNLLKFWEKYEKKWRDAKKHNNKNEVENYFDIMEKLKLKFGALK